MQTLAAHPRPSAPTPVLCYLFQQHGLVKLKDFCMLNGNEPTLVVHDAERPGLRPQHPEAVEEGVHCLHEQGGVHGFHHAHGVPVDLRPGSALQSNDGYEESFTWRFCTESLSCLRVMLLTGTLSKSQSLCTGDAGALPWGAAGWGEGNSMSFNDLLLFENLC